ncbi:MAG: acetyl-CoA synthetase, partial [Candidatus Thorarchaeota archaeon]
YVEGFRTDEGRKFIEICRKVVSKKPVVILKGGQSDAGHRATQSHTSSLAGSREVTSAAVRQ